jgi:hypothetical protein
MGLLFGLVGAAWGAAFPGHGYDRLAWICFYSFGFGMGGFFYGGLLASAVVLLTDFVRYQHKKEDERALHRHEG